MSVYVVLPITVDAEQHPLAFIGTRLSFANWALPLLVQFHRVNLSAVRLSLRPLSLGNESRNRLFGDKPSLADLHAGELPRRNQFVERPQTDSQSERRNFAFV